MALEIQNGRDCTNSIVAVGVNVGCVAVAEAVNVGLGVRVIVGLGVLVGGSDVRFAVSVGIGVGVVRIRRSVRFESDSRSIGHDSGPDETPPSGEPEVSQRQAHALVTEAAGRLGVEVSQLDYAIWLYQSGNKPV